MPNILQNKHTGQIFVSIPKGLAEATGWVKGTPVEWEIVGKDKLKLEKVKG